MILVGMSPLNGVYASSTETDRLFDQGLKKFLRGQYISARLDFWDIIHEFPTHPRTSAASLMAARCLFHLGEYDECLRELSLLKDEFPKSRYLDFAEYLEGHCFFKKKQWTEAAARYHTVITKTTDERLKQRARRMLYEGIARLADNASKASITSTLNINLALPEEEQTVPGDLKRLRKPSRSPDNLIIGVVLPLSPPEGYARLGESLERGIRMAVDSHPLSHQGKVTLLFEDTKSDPVEAALGTERLIHSGALAIIGPIYTESTIPAATLANAYEVPFIAPTASHGTLTDIGPYIYQLNLNPLVQGRNLAKYAVEERNLSTFAVLSTTDNWGHWICEGFVEEVEKRGCEVLVEAWYDPDQEEIGGVTDQMLELRRYAPLPDSVDSLITVNDSLVVWRFQPEVTEETDLFYDGILVSAPGSYEATYIASQLAYHKIHGQILGDTGWSSRELMEPDKIPYVRGAIFIGSYDDESDRPANREFLAKYRKLFGEDPTQVSALGYDAANLILQQLMQGRITSSEIKKGLDNVAGYEGVFGKIILSGKRFNIAMKLMRVTDRGIVSAP